MIKFDSNSIKQRRLQAEKRETEFWLPFVNKLFQIEFTKLDTYNHFDFYNKQYETYIEVKDLTQRFGQYSHVAIGSDKIKAGIEILNKTERASVIFIFKFGEQIAMFDLTHEIGLNSSESIIYDKRHRMLHIEHFVKIDSDTRIKFMFE